MAAALPIFAVFGASGQLGGSVIKAALHDKQFLQQHQLRAIVHNLHSDKVECLKKEGVEVVQGDYYSPQSLHSALNGVTSVFGITNFWDPNCMSEEKEFEAGKNIVDAAKACGVKQLIWSGLPAAKEETQINVAHFDSKARVTQYLIKSGLGVKWVICEPPFFYTNFETILKPMKCDGNECIYQFPDVPDFNHLAVWPKDYGVVVVNILKNFSTYQEKIVLTVGDRVKFFSELPNKLSKCLGMNVKFEKVPKDKYQGPHDMYDMFEYFSTKQSQDYFGFGSGAAKLGEQAYGGKLHTWDDYLCDKDTICKLKECHKQCCGGQQQQQTGSSGIGMQQQTTGGIGQQGGLYGQQSGLQGQQSGLQGQSGLQEQSGLQGQSGVRGQQQGGLQQQQGLHQQPLV